MKFNTKNSIFKEIFDKSPAGIFCYDKEGNLIHANSTALEMAGINSLDDFKKINLFDHPEIASKKEELLKNGLIKFQSQFNFDNVKNIGHYNHDKSGIIYVDYTISITDSTFLVQVQDITKHRRVEKALKESESRFHSLYENSFDAILLTTPDGSILKANPAAQKMFLMSEDELIKVGREGVLVCNKQARFALKERKEKGEIRVELNHRRKDGSIFPGEITSNCFIDADGSVKTSMIIRDLTERKKAEELQNSLNYIYNLINSNLNADKIMEKIVIEASKAIGAESASITLREGKEWLIKYIYNLPQEMVGNTFADKYNPHGMLAVKTKRVIPINDTCIDENVDVKVMKEYVIRSLLTVPLILNDEVIGLLYFNYHSKKVSFKDYHIDFANNLAIIVSLALQNANLISNLESKVRKRTEELENAYSSLKASSKENKRLTDLVELSEQPFGIAYPDGSMGYVNKAFENLVGYTKNELKTINWSLSLTPSKWREIENKKLKELESNNKPIKYEKEYIRKDGTIVPVELFTHLIKDKNGKIIYYYAFVTDLTERKKAENKLKEIIGELERSNTELESFAYITSHDLQEPLRNIASYAQLIERRYKNKLDPDADEFIEFMVDGSRRMKQMIQGLLNYSRVGTRGKEFTEFESENALNYALGNLGTAISEINAEITYDELPVIFADESQIIQVFQNLIGNALKFRREGIKPKIHISAKKEDNEYVFSVNDNGIGLEEQYNDQIFEVFKRLHAMDEYQGAGIGLAIVKRIIDRHGGRIWVKSKLGKGSAFYFTIPNGNKAILRIINEIE
ncbi:PAS domain S-box protein [Methanobacterium sp.]|uniref:PAS domain S-box protein n=1 Tax=Methanobacterium sp. TaxID=2164 RepID=UPI003C7596A0